MDKEKLQEISFQIIAKSGQAKTEAINAMKLAKEEKIQEANLLLEKANQTITEVGKFHMDVIVAEGKNQKIPFSPLFMHAEDQFLTTQTIIEMASHIIDLHKKILEKNNF